MTLLIEHRIREWAGSNAIIPDSQNGFREGYRTNNNSYILRCSIDRARAEGKTLFVAFIDLSNAFPATDLPTLWTGIRFLQRRLQRWPAVMKGRESAK
jgi:hypothetical protein